VVRILYISHIGDISYNHRVGRLYLSLYHYVPTRIILLINEACPVRITIIISNNIEYIHYIVNSGAPSNPYPLKIPTVSLHITLIMSTIEESSTQSISIQSQVTDIRQSRITYNLKEATAMCQSINIMASKTQANDIIELIEEHSGSDVILSDDYDQVTGDPYVSADIPDHLLPELIKDHGCLIRSDDVSGDYLVCVPDSSEVFISKAMMESLELALEGSNVPMVYSSSGDVFNALVLPSIRALPESYICEEFVRHMSETFQELVDRREDAKELEHNETINEALKLASDAHPDKSVTEFISLMRKISPDRPCNISLDGDKLIINSSVIHENTMGTIIRMYGDRITGYETLKVDCDNDKITTTNPELIADLRLHLIKTSLNL